MERENDRTERYFLVDSQPVCAALSGVNMEGWTGGNDYEKCQDWGEGDCYCEKGPPTASLLTFS